MCQADHSKCTVTEKPLYITYTIVYSVFAIYYRKCILWIILIKQKCFKALIFFNHVLLTISRGAGFRSTTVWDSEG